MPTPEAMTAAVHEYVRALNDADLDAIVALYAPDGVVEDPVGAPLRRGHDEIRDFYAASVAMKLRVALEGQVRVASNCAVFPFSVSVQHEGRAMTIRPIDVFRFDAQGRIAHMQAYFGPANIEPAQEK